MSLAKTHLSNIGSSQLVSLQSTVRQQFTVEGGASLRSQSGRSNAQFSVAFVSLDKFTKVLKQGNVGIPLQKRIGKEVGEFILHEAGHSMGAPDSRKGIMTGSFVLGSTFGMSTSYVPRHFSKSSKAAILKHLESLPSP